MSLQGRSRRFCDVASAIHNTGHYHVHWDRSAWLLPTPELHATGTTAAAPAGQKRALIFRTANCATAPDSHQKRRHRSASNAIEIKPKHSKINEGNQYSAAHNGLVAGSSPAGPTKNISILLGLR
ncbi:MULTISPECIES: hypothetical protein, partial [unclassified Bradyrhizobium]